MDEICQALADAALNRKLEGLSARQIEEAITHVESVLTDRNGDERLAAADSLYVALLRQPSAVATALRTVADVLSDHIASRPMSA